MGKHTLPSGQVVIWMPGQNEISLCGTDGDLSLEDAIALGELARALHRPGSAGGFEASPWWHCPYCAPCPHEPIKPCERHEAIDTPADVAETKKGGG